METTNFTRSIAFENDKHRMFQAGHERYVGAESYLKSEGFTEEFTNLSTDQWLQLSDEQYGRLEYFAKGLHDRTTRLGDPEVVTRLHMNPDFPGLVKHIRIVQNILEQYAEVGEDLLYPKKTTKGFRKAQALNHDFSRFSGINGSFSPDVIDGVDDVQMKRLMPDFPANDYLHHIKQVTGVEEIPFDRPAAILMKIADTLGKPDKRDPETFFAPGGGYERWVNNERQKGSFPINIFDSNADPKRSTMDLDTYAARDTAYTLAGYDYIQGIFLPRGLDFNQVLDKARNIVNNDTTLVENFGKEVNTN